MPLTEDRLIPPTSLGPEKENDLIGLFWPDMPLGRLERGDHSAFFDRVFLTLESLQPYDAKYAAKTFGDVQFIIEMIRDDQQSTQGALLQLLKERFGSCDDAAILRSIDLVIQMWLGLNIYSTTSFARVDAWDSSIRWRMGETLRYLVSSDFNKLRRPTGVAFHFDALFTVARLRHICRLKIRWTWNLIDHLKLKGRAGHRTLSIYQYKTCLVNNSRSNQSIIGRDILTETLRTLELMFPLGDPDTEVLLNKEGISMHSIRADGDGDRPRSMDEFNYWRARLEEIQKVFDSPPETFAQAMLDIRNPNQWATIWVSIFGIFILTLLFGALATIYAVKQYKIAQKSYDLSVAVACQERNGPLPGFC